MGFKENKTIVRVPGAVDIPGYEGLYQADGAGDIHSLLSGKKLKPGTAGNGYLKVGLWKSKKCKYEFVHRLVALALIHGDVSLTVNHKDGNKRNNKVDNLEFVSLSKNIAHSHQTLTRKSTLARNYAGGIDELLGMADEWKAGETMYAVAKRHGTHPGVFRDQLKSLGARP